MNIIKISLVLTTLCCGMLVASEQNAGMPVEDVSPRLSRPHVALSQQPTTKSDLRVEKCHRNKRKQTIIPTTTHAPELASPSPCRLRSLREQAVILDESQAFYRNYLDRQAQASHAARLADIAFQKAEQARMKWFEYLIAHQF